MTMDLRAAFRTDSLDSDIYVGPTCHVQTAESRFGPDVLEELKMFVLEPPHDNDMGFDDDDDDAADEEDVDEDDEGDVEMYDPDEGFADDHSFETDPNHAQHGFPRVATTRCNLTALSQRYNLYFAAYQDRIYVFQPRRGPHILPQPSLILHPRPSKLATCYGGIIDRVFPHQINHMIVGNLGDLEIVLFAYDDGDVAAYYTHTIVRCIRANTSQARGPAGGQGRHATHPKPFFHENVGRSAWGLAVHERSRLIAVGSNLHEVTVFAFAVTHNRVPVKFPEVDNSPKTMCGQTALELQKHFQSRTRTWRIILPLGRAGNNIPNLTFVDDEAGEADKVAAIDILDNVWLLDIWRIGVFPVQWPNFPDRDSRSAGGVRGWGVAILPPSSFTPTKTIRESLGLPGYEVIRMTHGESTWLDTTCSLYWVKELSPDPNAVLRQRARFDYARLHAGEDDTLVDQEASDNWESYNSGPDSEVENVTTMVETLGETSAHSVATGRVHEQWPALTAFSETEDSDFDDMSDEIQLSRFIIPSFGETPRLDGSTGQHMEFSHKNAERKRKTKPVEFAKAELPPHLKDYCLLRTSLTDIELQPFDRRGTGIVCRHVLTLHVPPGVNTSWDMHPAYSERICMVLHVPELNLVVAGAPVGRVALITLTKTARNLKGTPVGRGFRVDRVLPRQSEDEQKLRPGCPLIGIAISPVPDPRTRGLDLRPPKGRTPPVMYRLILHYKDHTILMYDIARGLSDADLMIF
ncbi:hypothetical protein VTK56DRAFT_2445 [Thermocarpiscus australiensis]